MLFRSPAGPEVLLLEGGVLVFAGVLEGGGGLREGVAGGGDEVALSAGEVRELSKIAWVTVLVTGDGHPKKE